MTFETEKFEFQVSNLLRHEKQSYREKNSGQTGAKPTPGVQ